MEQTTKNLSGLRGWLIVFAIGIILAPLRICVQILQVYMPIFFTPDYLQNMANTYGMAFKYALITEAGINLILFCVTIYIVYLFFSKRRALPKWYIGFSIFSIIFVIIDSISIKLIIPSQPWFDFYSGVTLMREALGCAIWIPYLMLSKRVQATFVR